MIPSPLALVPPHPLEVVITDVGNRYMKDKVLRARQSGDGVLSRREGKLRLPCMLWALFREQPHQEDTHAASLLFCVASGQLTPELARQSRAVW